MTNIFKGLIKCKNCGKNYKFKMMRKKPHYICSGYANYSKDFCIGHTIAEEELIYVLNKHLNESLQLNSNYIKEIVFNIEVVGRGYIVNYMDDSQSIINVEDENGAIIVRY